MMEWLDRHLVPGWRDSWRWWGNQATVAWGAVSAAVVAVPDGLPQLAMLMGGAPRLQAVIVGISLLIIVLRMWNQEDSNDDA